jgi:hypothetical protein
MTVNRIGGYTNFDVVNLRQDGSTGKDSSGQSAVAAKRSGVFRRQQKGRPSSAAMRHVVSATQQATPAAGITSRRANLGAISPHVPEPHQGATEPNRVKKQTPSPDDPYFQTFDAYGHSASYPDAISAHELGLDAEQQGALDNQCAGLTTQVLRHVATGQAKDLAGATHVILAGVRDSSTRQATIDEIRRLQTANTSGTVTDMPGLEMHDPGTSWGSASGFVKELGQHFSTRSPSGDGRGSAQEMFAEVTLEFGDEGHAILVQREGRTSDYKTDNYQIYDPNMGTFHYRGFDSLATAFSDVFERGYRTFGGVTGAQAVYYADLATWQPYEGVTPDIHRNQAQNTALREFSLGRNFVLTPPDVAMPPPDFDQPGPSGWSGGPHTELKRSTDKPEPDHPFALFRPSRTSPDDLRKQQGFSVEDTSLRNTSLDLHDALVNGRRDDPKGQSVLANPAATDGGGYLGTFANRNTAQARLDAAKEKDGYVYYVAPSPNMVDVTGSLGSTHARAADQGEVAAMGHIDYTQIRGWQKYEHGKLGPYVSNPDYRWDIYDQTRTSGSQPQLAHFRPDNEAWADADHRAFATPFQQDGRTLYRPKEDPALAQARFYQHANAAIGQRVKDQAEHREYRGPVSIQPLWNNSGSKNPVRLNITTGSASLDRAKASGGADQFRMDDEGRIHVANDDSKVLRIDGHGNAYIGAVPTDGNLNGVFRYDAKTGALIHAEDGKLLTEPIMASTPFVEEPQAADGLIERQAWHLVDAAGNQVQPPVHRAAFSNSTAGSAAQLRRFHDDPDSALPKDASHFVTSVPGVSFPGDTFLSWPDHIAQGDATTARNWLAQRNGAWLFKDGFYATASGPDTLEVRTLGGTPVWRAQIDPATGQETYTRVQDKLESNYQTPDRTWQRVRDNERLDATLYQRMGQNYM